jgi:predicted DNA-binding protein (MmcQ/YjbR family)
MAVPGASQRIENVVMTWPGVVSRPHRFGGTEFALGKREIGHVHGDHLLDIAFTRRVRDELIDAGLAQPHHIYSKSAWVSFYLNEEEDVERAVALLRRSYEMARERQERKYDGKVPRR